MRRILDDFIEGFMRFTEYSEAPAIYREWVAVGCVAAALQRKTWMQWDRSVYPNLYIVLVGPPAARKGTAMKPGRDLLRSCGIPLAAESTTREALINDLAAMSTKEVDSHGNTFMHSSLTVFSDEFTVFTGYQNKDLIMALTDWFDCESPWRYRTKNRGTAEIIGTWVNLVAATTPTTLHSAITNDVVGGGLISRIIFVYAHGKDKLVPLPHKQPIEQEALLVLMTELDVIKSMVGCFQTTDEFERIYEPWYVDQSNNPPFDDPKLAGYCDRRSLHLRKLAMIFSASESNDMIITEAHFKRALDLLLRTERLMPLTLIGAGDNTLARYIPQIISFVEAYQSDIIPINALIRRFYYDLTWDQLMEVLTAMRRMHDIDLKTDKSTGEVIVLRKKKEVKND